MHWECPYCLKWSVFDNDDYDFESVDFRKNADDLRSVNIKWLYAKMLSVKKLP